MEVIIIYGYENSGSGRGRGCDNGYPARDVQMDIDYSSDYSGYVEASNVYPPTYEEALKMKSLQTKESTRIMLHNPTTSSQRSNHQQPINKGLEYPQQNIDCYHYEQEAEEFDFITCLPMIIVIILLLIVFPKCLEKWNQP